MPKRPWKETKLVISLPDDVLAEYGDEATQLYTSTREFIRQLLIDRKRAPQQVVNAPTHAPGAVGSRTSRSGYKGVYAYGKRWEAVVYVNRRRQRLGVYDTAEAAARAYDDHLVVQAGGDPNAAVNFPGPGEVAAQAHTPFVEQFASGRRLTDIEWKQWQQQQQPAGAALEAPLTVRPEGPSIDSSTPLIDRPSKTLYRRESLPIPMPRPDPDPDDDDGTLS